MMRKVLCITALLLAVALNGQAQQRKHFDYEKFKTEMLQFIVAEAGLTSTQAQQFRPVCETMLAQKRTLFRKIKETRKTAYANEKDYKNAIQKIDNWEIEMKNLERAYHNQLLRFLPASKVFMVIRAEAKYHKQTFRKAAAK